VIIGNGNEGLEFDLRRGQRSADVNASFNSQSASCSLFKYGREIANVIAQRFGRSITKFQIRANAKVEEKPVEKKPDPPKPVAEQKPKEEPKPIEKKPEPPKVDPIAEALKKDEKKPPPKPQAQAAKPPEPAKPKKDYVFDQSKMAALLDKRDPSRQSIIGETLNSNAALGLAKGKASDNSATWGSMFRRQVENCWKKPYGGVEQERPEIAFAIRLKRDGTLEAMPVPDGTPPSPYARAYQESALRAIIQCQPYNLPAVYFEEWKAFTPVFQEKPI